MKKEIKLLLSEKDRDALQPLFADATETKDSIDV